MQTIGITGGTGLVGRQVASLLVSKGYSVILLTRNPSGKKAPDGCTLALFDPASEKYDLNALKSLNAVIHLAGEPVTAKRWTNKQKAIIAGSRIKGSQFLVKTLAENAPDCKTLIAASAIGYYGPDSIPTVPFPESHPPYNDFLGDTCRQWEAEVMNAKSFLRTAILRTGIVLAAESGAFVEFVKPTRFGLLPIPGNGRQVISWIHVSDIANLFVYALEHNDMSGVYNAVAPTPVTCSQLLSEIKTAKGGFLISAHVPAFMLRIILGEMSVEVLKSCTASASKTLQSGFTFNYPDIKSAVSNLLKKR